MRQPVAVVTGAGRGIGRAVATAIADSGMDTLAVSLTAKHLEGLQRPARGDAGRIETFAADVSEPSEVEKAFIAADEMGTVEVLVCCAGILIRDDIASIAPADFKRVLDVNVTGTFLCAQQAFTRMRSGGGRIVTFSSLAGVYGTEKFPGLASYVASKHAVVGLTEALAVEGRPFGISSVCLSPGAVDTEMLRQANPDLRPGLTPAEVGNIVIKLLDRDLEAISGVNIPIYSNR